jgi:hypothetical protein
MQVLLSNIIEEADSQAAAEEKGCGGHDKDKSAMKDEDQDGSTKNESEESDMTEEQVQKMIEEALTPVTEQISKMNEGVQALVDSVTKMEKQIPGVVKDNVSEESGAPKKETRKKWQDDKAKADGEVFKGFFGDLSLEEESA